MIKTREDVMKAVNNCLKIEGHISKEVLDSAKLHLEKISKEQLENDMRIMHHIAYS